MRLLALALVVSGCSFPTVSDRFACQANDECPADRECDRGFCVVRAEADAAVVAPPPDAVVIDSPPDADPFVAISETCLAAGYTKDPTTGVIYRAVAQGTLAKNWGNANADCKDDVPGATHLIVLSSTAEVALMDSLFGADAWIGLTDQAVENSFETVTGETGDQRPFRQNPLEPNNGGNINNVPGEDCVVMRNGTGGLLDDVPCTGVNMRYLCECDGKPSKF